MENGVRLVFEGMCKDCSVADLDLKQFYRGIGQSHWIVECGHMQACLQMRAAMEQKGEGNADTDESNPGQVSGMLL